MSGQRYDIVVIGAGIHGAGVAQAGAARGHRVLVLEQSAIAAATSSRSSKLIHGGLRYLESAQFALVRECLHERALLLKLAPELVRLRPFYIPVYRTTRRRPGRLRLGLTLYALLAGLGRSGRYRTLPPREWGMLDGLDTRDLQQVFQYWDAQTDDAALTRAVLHSAQTLGARLALPALFVGAELHAEGCTVLYKEGERELSCEARVLINAAGAWVNQALARIRPAVEARPVDLVQGTHIVVEGGIQRGIYYLESPRDRRAVFVMPWKQQVLVGTTETRFHGDPAAVAPLPEERDYLIEILAHYFPAYRAAGGQRILESFAGLRVLPAGPGTAFGRPRETVLHTDRPQRPRVLSIYGGKLTAYRATAEKILKRLEASLPERRAVARTDRLPLTPSAEG